MRFSLTTGAIPSGHSERGVAALSMAAARTQAPPASVDGTRPLGRGDDAACRVHAAVDRRLARFEATAPVVDDPELDGRSEAAASGLHRPGRGRVDAHDAIRERRRDDRRAAVLHDLLRRARPRLQGRAEALQVLARAAHRADFREVCGVARPAWADAGALAAPRAFVARGQGGGQRDRRHRPERRTRARTDTRRQRAGGRRTWRSAADTTAPCAACGSADATHAADCAANATDGTASATDRAPDATDGAAEGAAYRIGGTTCNSAGRAGEVAYEAAHALPAGEMGGEERCGCRRCESCFAHGITSGFVAPQLVVVRFVRCRRRGS